MQIHFIDVRRPRGRMVTGGREDGTGYRSQIEQYPVICSLDFVDDMPTQGSRPPVTDNPRLATCKECKEIIKGIS